MVMSYGDERRAQIKATLKLMLEVDEMIINLHLRIRDAMQSSLVWAPGSLMENSTGLLDMLKRDAELMLESERILYQRIETYYRLLGGSL